MFLAEAENVASRLADAAKDQKPATASTAKPRNALDHLLRD
jgi:hypothetical protein